MDIHRTAVVEPGAELGVNVTVGPYAYIQDGARLGDGCRIGPHASVFRYTTLGPDCHVHAGAVLGDTPQDVSFRDEPTYLTIGASCRIREYVTVHRGSKPGSATEIGDNCYLMALSHCGHNVKLGQGVIVANECLLAGYVEVGDRVFMSGGASVHQFVRIGRLAMLSGRAMAAKDVPPFCTLASGRLNVVVGLNVVGMRRAGLTGAQRLEVKRGFDLLYRSGLNVGQAVERMRETAAGGAARELCDFVAASRRGICRFSSMRDTENGGGMESDEAAKEEAS